MEALKKKKEAVDKLVAGYEEAGNRLDETTAKHLQKLILDRMKRRWKFPCSGFIMTIWRSSKIRLRTADRTNEEVRNQQKSAVL